MDQTHTFRWVNDFADPIHHRASLGITFPKPPEGEEPIESYSFKVDGEEVKLKSETTTDDDEVCMEWNGAITIAPNRSVPVVKRSTRFIELDDRWTYQPVTPVCGLHVTCNFDQSVNPRLTFFGYETENCSEPIRKTRFASLDTKGWMLPRHVVLLEWSPPSIPESLFPDTEVTPETAIAPEAVDIDTRHRGE